MLSFVKKRISPAKDRGPTAEEKGKAPEAPPIVTTTNTLPASVPTLTRPSVDGIKSPVLSPSDEEFLKHAIEDAEEPLVIFPGSETTSGTVTPIVEEAARAAEEEVKEDELKTAEKGEWKDAIVSRWHGLKKTVDERRKSKVLTPKEGEEVVDKKGKGKEKEEEPKDKKGKNKEFERPEEELTAALDQLNLTAEDGRAFSLSAETTTLLQKFTQILKDLINGVPTAYDDLTSFLDSSSKQLESTFSDLPGFLQKLIKNLPKKFSPELMKAAAAASPAVAERTASIPGLKELVTKPGMLTGLLRSVLNVLRTRFPALLGGSAALSMGLFVVLFVLWYCYKRGREVRLEMEDHERAAIASLEDAEKDAVAAAQQSAGESDLQGGSKF